jgi:hypothetical protein
VTVPVGVVLPLACLTVAVNVTEVFCVRVDADEVKVVVVLTTAWLTVTETAADVEGLRVPVPEYTAVIVSVPTGREDVEIFATPEESTAEPRDTVPL